MTPLEQAHRRVVCNTGQISKLDAGRLNRAAKRGEIEKWRGHWFPIPGAPWGLGPLKSCWGPLGSMSQLGVTPCPAT